MRAQFPETLSLASLLRFGAKTDRRLRNVQLLQHVAMLLDHNFTFTTNRSTCSRREGRFCDLAHRSGIRIHCGHNVVFGMRTCCTFMLRNRHLLEPTPSSRLVPARSPFVPATADEMAKSYGRHVVKALRFYKHALQGTRCRFFYLRIGHPTILIIMLDQHHWLDAFANRT